MFRRDRGLDLLRGFFHRSTRWLLLILEIGFDGLLSLYRCALRGPPYNLNFFGLYSPVSEKSQEEARNTLAGNTALLTLLREADLA